MFPTREKKKIFKVNKQRNEKESLKELHLYPPKGRQVSSFRQDSESWVPDFVV